MEKSMGDLIDASTGEVTAVTVPTANESESQETLQMVAGCDEEDIVGRMSTGFDVTDFDQIARDRVYETANMSEGAGGDELDLLSGDDMDIPMFTPPPREQFPVFKQALREFQAAEGNPKIARIDNEDSYSQFVADKAVEELTRRMDALEATLHQHMEDDDNRFRARDSHEVLGAAKAVADLHHAQSPAEALDAIPNIPVDLPPFAEGKVKCWRDGDYIICSMKFRDVHGGERIATMAAKPRVDERAMEMWAEDTDADPVTMLGILHDAADVACGKRLLSDTAKAALAASTHDEVVGMGEIASPILLGRAAPGGNAPLAALMYLQQRADAGDDQAETELAKIRIAAQTKSGKAIAQPLLDEADRRLSSARQHKIDGTTFGGRYQQMLLGAG